MENIEFFHYQLSLARGIAVSHKNYILTDRIFLQISGRKQISAQPVVNGTTVSSEWYYNFILWFQIPNVSSPATEAESDLKNANVSSHQIPPSVEESNSEELIGMENGFSRTLLS